MKSNTPKIIRGHIVIRDVWAFGTLGGLYFAAFLFIMNGTDNISDIVGALSFGGLQDRCCKGLLFSGK